MYKQNNNVSTEGRSRNNNGFKSRRNFNRSGNSNSERKNYGSQRGFNSNNFRNRTSKRFQPQKIDISLFVKKSSFIEKVEFKPTNSFESLDLNKKLKSNLLQNGFIKMTPIQDAAIPNILENKDVIGIANTGTGKTLAFLLPLINKYISDSTQKVLIIVPTRELAVQIRDEFLKINSSLTPNPVLCIGGTDIRRQIINLKKKNDFVIGTPGRLKDLMMRKVLNLKQYNNIVLDEVDRMLDMGFLPEVKILVEKMAEEKQSLFFSATFGKKVEAIAMSFMKDPVNITVKTQETSENIDQDIVYVNSNNKFEILSDLLQKSDFQKVLVFSSTKRNVEKLEEKLMSKGHKVESIHGDKSQFKRQKALDSFKQGKSNVLIATDVVARGIDVKDISHVINFDIPNTYEDYIHRIGRTGRGDKTGKALTFIEK